MLKVRTRGYQGNILKGATVTSNDPKFPKKFLRITAQVEPVIMCKPAPYIFTNKPYGKEMVKTLAVWSPVTPQFRIKSVKSLMRHVSVEIVRQWTEKKSTHYNLKVTLGKDMPIGRFQGVIEILTNLKKFPTYNLRISGIVEGPVKVLPSRGTMFSDPKIMDGMASAGFSLYGTHFRVTKVTSEAKELKKKLVTVVPGKKYYLVAVWPGGPTPTNPYTIHLKVYTDNPIESVIDVPLTIYSRRVVKKRQTGSSPMNASPPKAK